MYNNATSKMNEMSKYIVMTLLWSSKDEEEDDSTN